MLVSPAEPHEFYQLGTVTSLTEKYGADFMDITGPLGRVGVQRKTVSDLIASVQDGRVEREVWQMRALDQAIWLIEGETRWTGDGQLLSAGNTSWTKSQHLGVLLSLCLNGYWLLSSSSISDSIALLSSLSRWLAKDRHDSLLRRPSASTSLGRGAIRKTDRQIHVMQGFDRVGYGKARDIVGYYGGLPFQLADGVDLTDVKGIGDKMRNTIEETF